MDYRRLLLNPYLMRNTLLGELERKVSNVLHSYLMLLLNDTESYSSLLTHIPPPPTAINEFLSTHSAFEVIRTSGKVVVFDVRISVQLAFYALVEHDMQAAPLWDAR